MIYYKGSNLRELSMSGYDKVWFTVFIDDFTTRL